MNSPFHHLLLLLNGKRRLKKPNRSSYLLHAVTRYCFVDKIPNLRHCRLRPFYYPVSLLRLHLLLHLLLVQTRNQRFLLHLQTMSPLLIPHPLLPLLLLPRRRHLHLPLLLIPHPYYLPLQYPLLSDSLAEAKHLAVVSAASSFLLAFPLLSVRSP